MQGKIHTLAESELETGKTKGEKQAKHRDRNISKAKVPLNKLQKEEPKSRNQTRTTSQLSRRHSKAQCQPMKRKMYNSLESHPSDQPDQKPSTEAERELRMSPVTRKRSENAV